MIKMYYINEPEAMLALVQQLIRASAWFDVRIPRDHRWQISFNIEHCGPIAKKLATQLIEPPPTEQVLEARQIKDVASMKAERRKLFKGKRHG